MHASTCCFSDDVVEVLVRAGADKEARDKVTSSYYVITFLFIHKQRFYHIFVPYLFNMRLTT